MSNGTSIGRLLVPGWPKLLGPSLPTPFMVYTQGHRRWHGSIGYLLLPITDP